jgi:DNA polymerase-3 subunit epsilon
LDRGRTEDENAIVLVEEGMYRGYGFIERSEINGNLEVLKDAIKPFSHNPEVVGIIQRFVYKDKVEQLIKLPI